ncbi:hypothetical protein B1813_22870 [Saccharomonospora piscinae]|uniref:Uncharacterized protein n=1 Tax=Saccharomonospora piscinae TaxID=687388 RepID=A0A1V8ZW11_SACPI|nr:hypothetical protein B1813_22870 [Saccharomonospora piscinae]
MGRYVRDIEAGAEIPGVGRIRRDYEPGGPGTGRAGRIQTVLREIQRDVEGGLLRAPVSTEAVELYVAAYDQRDEACRQHIEHRRAMSSAGRAAQDVATDSEAPEAVRPETAHEGSAPTAGADRTATEEAAPTAPVHPETAAEAVPASSAAAPVSSVHATASGTPSDMDRPTEPVQPVPTTPRVYRPEGGEAAHTGTPSVARTDGVPPVPVPRVQHETRTGTPSAGHTDTEAAVPAPPGVEDGAAPPMVQTSESPRVPDREAPLVDESRGGVNGAQRANGAAIRARLVQVQGAEDGQEGEPGPVPPVPTTGADHVETETTRPSAGTDRPGAESGIPVHPVQHEARTGTPGAGRTDTEAAVPVRVRPGALALAVWVVVATVVAGGVVLAVQTPTGQRVWDWLSGAVGTDALTLGAVAGGAGLLAAVVGLAARWVYRYRAARGGRTRSPLAPRAYLVSALAFMGLSVDTTIRFFQDKLGIKDPLELALIFGGMELGLLACGIAMREAVRRGDEVPASAQTVAWGLAGLAGLTGLLLGGWPGGLVRAAGPALAMVMLHMALGVELRHAKPGDRAPRGAVARMVSELRERALARFGLADEGRTALVRSRRRAARRAAQLVLQQPPADDVKARRRRDQALQRELAKADVAQDQEARGVFLHEVSVLQAMHSPEALVAAVRELNGA